MGGMKDLFGDELVSYPKRPGYTEPTTSKDAAEAVIETAETLRAKVLEALRVSPATVHEMAARLDKTVPSIQPRFSELRASGKIEPTGKRRPNASGMSAHVWRAV